MVGFIAESWLFVSIWNQPDRWKLNPGLTFRMSDHYNRRCFHCHMNQFEIGDKVVYPNHGVGIIEKISNRLVAGKFERFYLLRICSNDILVMVPTVNAGDVGLRKIIDRKDVNQLLNYLGNDKFFTQRDWKDRFKENSERMRSGSIFHVAEVFKNLVHLSRVKPLSFREKRMLDRARFLLISELSTVMNLREIEIEARIEKAVTKACGKGPAPAAEA
jgi:CarD family transcriptional regulator